MAEKQLTVAELMARAQKEGRTSEPRRRRRRYADEGGVSLAELTGSIPRVRGANQPAHHESIQDAEKTQVISQVDSQAEAEQTEEQAQPATKVETVAAAPKKEEKQASDEESADQPLSLFSDDPIAVEHDHENEHKTSGLAVFFMSVVGVIIGIAFFYGFSLLWDHFNIYVTAVLGIAVTAGAVGVVHALHTEKPKLSMALAALAALVVTFGPYLV